jgi:ammonia channel protein AmtB
MFIWSTIIYDPIACWTWNPAGWTFKMGGLDFAGGTPVHISSGAAALAYSIMLGKRRGYNDVSGLPYRPHNVTHIVLGTVFLWVGWFGFNGGSALAANMRARLPPREEVEHSRFLLWRGVGPRRDHAGERIRACVERGHLRGRGRGLL